MRSALAHAAQHRAQRRQRSGSLPTVPPAETSNDYNPELAAVAASILYRSPLPSQHGRPVYILNAASFPDAFEVDYDSLLSYVLARLPGEDELISGTEYEIIFFAGGQAEGATAEKKQGPGMGWYLQAYHVLSRAMRKKLQRLYIVHPKTWVRVLVGVFGTVVSPKFRRKIIHVNTLSALALHIPLEKLLIPPSVYLYDRKLSPDIYAPFATGRRAFGVKHPLPKNINTGETRLPRVVRETTSFVLHPLNVKTEGLFRIPPNSVLAGVLKEAYDRGQYYIVWKERGVTVVQPGIDRSLVDEVRLEDAYSVHSAASLIKQWYRDLREPIFPESSYDTLKEKYGDQETKVTPEDLVEMILPESTVSPLTKKSRKILTRHLLPLLSEVAAHEPENKMNAENLAVCFCMCLVCGSNQMEDVKISSIVRRILQAAIEMWPQLRVGMSISAQSFFNDLEAPSDLRNYEDPLEEERPPRQQLAKEDIMVDEEGHRIILEDTEEGSVQERVPTLPPRPKSGILKKIAPSLPPRPQAASSDVSPVSADSASSIPKRKPAPSVDPPRYSTVFDTEGNSLHVADSPASYVPVDGFGPPRRGPWSYDESEKKGFLPQYPETTESQPGIGVPKRKAVSGEHKTEESPGSALNVPKDSGSMSGSNTPVTAAAQKAATDLSQQLAAALNTSSPTEVVQSPESVLSEGDGVFRKPSWPASARPQSLAKPVLPPRQAQTVPIPSNGHLTASNLPKPRAPSPGLLARMSSMEASDGTGPSAKSALQPQRLNLKKASVEDLRRLYEERLSTVEGLAKADAARRASTSTL